MAPPMCDKEKLKELREVLPSVPVIRSTEIAAIAFEKKLPYISFAGDKRDVLKAILYALKFSGCSISRREIEEYPTVVRYN